MAENKTDNKIFEFASCDDTFIYKLQYSEAEYVCFAAAMRNNVFDIVKEHQPIKRSDIITKAKYGKRGGEAIINVVTALGLLKCIDKNYYLTEQSMNYLTESSLFSWKSMLNFFYDKLDPYFKAIDAELYVDDGIVNNWSSGQIDPEMAAKFTECMQSQSASAANGFAKRINLKEKFGVSRMMDIGGGSGCFCISTAYHQPGVKTLVFDLEPVCKVAQKYIEKSNIPAGSVITYAGNMFTESFPAHDDLKYGSDAHFYSNIFHDWNDEKCLRLAKKSFDTLPENGVILLHEALLDEDGNGPLITAFFSFKMFMGTEGKQFTLCELKDILEKAGFKDVGVIPTYGIYSVVYGVKK